jgi:RHS repeat-associated protein
VAFITQSQSYDPWSNVNAGSEYQLSGIQGDRYLVSGKENDSVTGNMLLDWRDYDSVTGRMNSFDPASTEGGQISLSPFAYSWNRPSMLNDPDGRCPMCIGFMIGMFTSTIGNLASGKQPSSIGQFLLPGVTGAIGAGMAGIFGQAGTFGGAVFLPWLVNPLRSVAWSPDQPSGDSHVPSRLMSDYQIVIINSGTKICSSAGCRTMVWWRHQCY